MKGCDTLYYDGACPLCSREIEKLKRLKQAPMEWVDISKDSQDGKLVTRTPDKEVPSQEAMLRRLHLKTAEGLWLKGLEANIYAWRHTRYYFLWRLLKLPVIFQVASFGYNRWAEIRYRRAPTSRLSE